MSPGTRAPGFVLVLDGPSQVGKTTTVNALQRAWPRVRSGPLLDVGLDRSVAGLGPAAGRWRELVYGGPDRRGQPVPRFGPLGRELLAGMHRAAAAWAWSGFDVVVEHVLLDRSTADDLVAALEGLPLLHVALTCDPDVLEDRELDAARSMPGRAVAELVATAQVTTRDVVLDTSQVTTEDLVDLLLAEVERRLAG